LHKDFHRTYSSESVQDLHLIPFSTSFPNRYDITKTACKSTQKFLIPSQYFHKKIHCTVKEKERKKRKEEMIFFGLFASREKATLIFFALSQAAKRLL
jgi:hypothetical protein